MIIKLQEYLYKEKRIIKIEPSGSPITRFRLILEDDIKILVSKKKDESLFLEVLSVFNKENELLLQKEDDIKSKIRQLPFLNILDVSSAEGGVFNISNNTIFKCYFDELTYDTNLNIQNFISLSNVASHTWTSFSKEIRATKTKCDMCGGEVGTNSIKNLEAHECLGLSIRDGEVVLYVLEVKCLCKSCHLLQHFQFVDLQIERGIFTPNIIKLQFEHYKKVTGDDYHSESYLTSEAHLRNIIVNFLLNKSYENRSSKFKLCLLDEYNGISTYKMKKYLNERDLLYIENPTTETYNKTYLLEDIPVPMFIKYHLHHM